MTSFAFRLLGASLTVGALLIAPATRSPAVAAPCPDIEVIFARGTTEPPGVGGIGQAFVDSLRSQLGGRSLGVYAVDYPASRDFTTSARAGAADLAAHAQSTAANCPATRMVLGGYSQGAGVVKLVTANLPPTVADHVAAAALFGSPRTGFADALSPGPLPSVGTLFASKTIDQCVPNDPICFDGGSDWGAHAAYIQSGMVDQAANFAASRA